MFTRLPHGRMKKRNERGRNVHVKRRQQGHRMQRSGSQTRPQIKTSPCACACLKHCEGMASGVRRVLQSGAVSMFGKPTGAAVALVDRVKKAEDKYLNDKHVFASSHDPNRRLRVRRDLTVQAPFQCSFRPR